MTLHRDGKWMQFECDECPATTDEYDDFDELREEAKRAGWEIKPSSDGWTHTCPDCLGGSKLERQRRLFG